MGPHELLKTKWKYPVFALLLLVFFQIYISYFGASVLFPVEHRSSGNQFLYASHGYPVLTYSHKTLPSGKYVDANLPSYPLHVSRLVVDLSSSSGVTIAVHPALVGNGDTVTVRWEGALEAAGSSDWIGLFCPPERPARRHVEYWLVREREHVTLRVYNMREDCQFRYYTNQSTTTLQLLATSNILRFKDGKKAPLQGHLALTGDPTEMRVQWTSGSRSTPVVHYGLTADRLDRTATGVSRTYSASDMCGTPANRSDEFIDPGFLHDVVIGELLPSSSYYYQYGSDDVFSEVNSFISSPQLGSDATIKIVTYGDMSIEPASAETVRRVEQEISNGASLIVHQGDLSYAVGYSYIWDQWMHLIEPLAVRVPYMVAIGNHEQDHMIDTAKDPSSQTKGRGFHPLWGNYHHDSGGECGVPTWYRFHMPDNGNRVWWYSFNYGPIHFTVMSSENDFTPGSRQYKWLENDMKSVNRHTTPWLILVAHRPMYSSEKYANDYKLSVHMRLALEDLLHQYNVDMFLCGHMHSYERTCPVYREQCNKRGTVHIVAGGAGFELDTIGQYEVTWSEHLEMTHGYGRIAVNRSSLLWEYIRNTDQLVADTILLLK